MRDSLGRPMPEREAMRQALAAAAAEKRPPTDADAPPLKTFPLTRAARAALRLSRNANSPG